MMNSLFALLLVVPLSSEAVVAERYGLDARAFAHDVCPVEMSQLEVIGSEEAFVQFWTQDLDSAPVADFDGVDVRAVLGVAILNGHAWQAVKTEIAEAGGELEIAVTRTEITHTAMECLGNAVEPRFGTATVASMVMRNCGYAELRASLKEHPSFPALPLTEYERVAEGVLNPSPTCRLILKDRPDGL